MSRTRRELPLSSSPSFRLVEVMCLPQRHLAGERWRECSRSCLSIVSSSGLVSEPWNKCTSVQTSIWTIATPRVCCVHCQPNPEKEDLKAGIERGERLGSWLHSPWSRGCTMFKGSGQEESFSVPVGGGQSQQQVLNRKKQSNGFEVHSAPRRAQRLRFQRQR